MRSIGVALLAAIVVATYAAARPEAVVGSSFADAYVAFAPLEGLYRSFGDHLFLGTAILVPEELGSSCDAVGDALARLHERLIGETSMDMGVTLGAVVRLRAAVEAFCATFGADLDAVDAVGSMSDETEERLVVAGFFAQIRDLDNRFADALDEALLAAGDGEPRWAMAVSFAVRTLLARSDWTAAATGDDLAALFYGGSEPAEPRFAVPDEVRSAMALIVAGSGGEMDEDDATAVHSAALVIYRYFIDDRPTE